MSTSSTTFDSSHEPQIQPDHVRRPSGPIRQRVEDRHWQLFEARLKKQSAGMNKENYTHPNDYRVIDRLTKVDQPQPPVEPTGRWESFCHRVQTKSKEADRVMSIFHNVWLKNWNVQQASDRQKRHATDPSLNGNTSLDQLITNDNDRKVVSSILHRTASSEIVPCADEKKN